MQADDSSIREKGELAPHPRVANPRAWYGTIVGLGAVIFFGAFFVIRAYLVEYRKKIEEWRPGKIARLEQDLPGINRDGRKVALGELKGKVFVAACQYTECPASCARVAAVMKMLLHEFGSDPRFHLVSISVDPAADTPEKLQAWMRAHGEDSDRWWFLSSDPEHINKYLSSQFKFFSPGKITDPARIAREGSISHDHRLFLVDGEANVRGYYGVIDPVGGETAIRLLKRDLDMVLHPEKKLRDYAPIPFPKTPSDKN